MDKARKNEHERLHNRWHARLVYLLDDAHEQSSVNFGLYLVEYLYHVIAQTDGCVLVRLRLEKLLGNINNFLGRTHLLDVCVSNVDKRAQC